MKKLLLIITIAILLIGCASDKEINGQNIESYGFINKDDLHCTNVNYDVSMGSAVMAVFVPIGTIVSLGFDLYEPVNIIDPKLPIICK